jgi:hypothetical protein
MNNNDNRPAAIALVILMLVLPGSLIAREKRGASIVVTFKDGISRRKLIAVKPVILLFAEKTDGPLAEVRSMGSSEVSSLGRRYLRACRRNSGYGARV